MKTTAHLIYARDKVACQDDDIAVDEEAPSEPLQTNDQTRGSSSNIRQLSQENLTPQPPEYEPQESDKYLRIGASGPSNSLANKKRFVAQFFKILMNDRRSLNSYETCRRVNMVRYIEQATGKEFRSTSELKEAVHAFIPDLDGRKKPVNERIRRMRRKLKLTQKQLAEQLGYKSHVGIVQFEKGIRYPSDRVLKWLQEAEMSQKKRG